MRKLLPTVALAMIHIAGDNLGVVPAFAVMLGVNIYWIIIVAYIILGTVVAGVAAWIGSYSGLELGTVVSRLFGCRGKQLLAVAILSVSIPASAITGGYFAGQLVVMLTGIPYCWAVIICLIAFLLLAAGWWRDFWIVINYVSFLLIPLVVVLAITAGDYNPPQVEYTGLTDWLLVLALFSYNAGGMRPAVVIEAAGHLAGKGYKSVAFAVAAKIIEGLFTLFIAYVVFKAPVYGSLILPDMADLYLGYGGAVVFKLVLLSTFIMTMAPAMMANAKQVVILTGVEFKLAMLISGLVVYAISLIDYQIVLTVMSGTGLIMVIYLGYIVCFLHKSGQKKL
ncbi:MAG: hypothetical protein H6Q74_180 [Firmicutes bacterium]|nr:hypothetical protein [Bacillota bacterium]